MAKIKMSAQRNETIAQTFSAFLLSASARGVKDKTMETYTQHFRAISKRLDTSLPIGELTEKNVDEMIAAMRKDGLSDTTINSYTRTFKVFCSWCGQRGLTNINPPIYKASETVKEPYTDGELHLLLKRPSASCGFCEFRSWVIENFLLNSGCRAATVRNIQNQDVDIENRQILLRHTKNRKIQVIPLCSAMVDILGDYMKVRGGSGTDYLFCNEYGEMLSENALRLSIAKYNRSRGVERTSIHCFRHTFARKYLIDCGGDAFTLQRLMGHSTLKMTKHYCAIFDADITKNYDNFSPLAQINRQREKIRR